MYLVLAIHLHWWTLAFSSWVSWELLFAAVQTSVAVCALSHVRSSWITGTETRVPWTGRQALTTGPPGNPNVLPWSAQGLHIFLQNGYQAVSWRLDISENPSLPRWPIEVSVLLLGRLTSGWSSYHYLSPLISGGLVLLFLPSLLLTSDLHPSVLPLEGEAPWLHSGRAQVEDAAGPQENSLGWELFSPSWANQSVICPLVIFFFILVSWPLVCTVFWKCRFAIVEI